MSKGKYKPGDIVEVQVNHAYPSYKGIVHSYTIPDKRLTPYYEIKILDPEVLGNSLVTERYTGGYIYKKLDGKRVIVYATERVYNEYSLTLLTCKHKFLLDLANGY